MEVNTKYSKNNKFNKDFNFLQLLKKVQEKFASKFLSQLQQLFNSENNNKLEQTEIKKTTIAKTTTKKPRRCCDWLFFSSGRFV